MASVQLAVALGAKVSTFSSAKNFEFAKNLGAIATFDYTNNEMSDLFNSFDVVFDVSSHFSYAQAKPLLTSKGVYITTNATLSAILLSPVKNIFRSKKEKVVMTAPDKEVLQKVKSIIEKNQVKPFIAKTFAFEEMKQAHTLAEQGGFTGKLVVEL